MLRRSLALALTITVSCLLVVFTAPVASAGCAYDPATGEVECGDEDPGQPGDGDDPGDDGGASSTCKYAGEEIPCSFDGGIWSSKHACYVTTRLTPQPPPPAGESADSGAWHFCLQPAGYQGSNQSVWISVSEILIDPAVLAQRVIASMDLDPIRIGIVPESGPNRVGLVGLPVWMWVDRPTDDTFGPITASASEGSVSVSATARVSSIVWNMGDGTTVRCTGEGTPYADYYGKQDSPTCGHRYEKMSTDQPDGAYQVTAASHWIVDWTGGGQSGTIEFDLTTDVLPIRIGEAQVLTQ